MFFYWKFFEVGEQNTTNTKVEPICFLSGQKNIKCLYQVDVWLKFGTNARRDHFPWRFLNRADEDTPEDTFHQPDTDTSNRQQRTIKQTSRAAQVTTLPLFVLYILFLPFPASHSLTRVSQITVRRCRRNSVYVTEQNVFAWRTLFQATLHVLHFSLSSGLAGGGNEGRLSC